MNVFNSIRSHMDYYNERNYYFFNSRTYSGVVVEFKALAD